jgi:hypothetical protein
MNILIKWRIKRNGKGYRTEDSRRPRIFPDVTGRDESALRSLSGAADNKNIHVMAIDTAKGAKELEGLKTTS